MREVEAPLPKQKRWERFIKLCEEIGHGELASVKIQDGVPVLVEKVTQKIKVS